MMVADPAVQSHFPHSKISTHQYNSYYTVLRRCIVRTVSQMRSLILMVKLLKKKKKENIKVAPHSMIFDILW